MSFKINRVYTRSGDDGLTGLVCGTRVEKSSTRVASYGEIDELNSFLGVIKEEIKDHKLKELIEFLQQELFDIGSELATKNRYPNMWQCSENHVLNLERLCDYFSEGLEELTSFILPGGSKAAANFHLARVVARRAERTIVRLSIEEKSALNNNIVKYINRLSDLFFILARYVLKEEGIAVPLWLQEKNRKCPY